MTSRRRAQLTTLAAGLLLLMPASAWAGVSPPRVADSQPGVDAPELAPLGPHPVGVRSLTLVEPGTPDLLAADATTHVAPVRDRTLAVDVWYPAKVAPGAKPVVYTGALDSETGPPAGFEIPGVAVRDAGADTAQTWPLVVMSHGYSGTPVAMSWLAENLASKGYVVAAAHHLDPPYGDPGKFKGPVLLRPLDIAFVAHTVLARARSGDGFFSGLVDPSRVALAGYSMGGYGALTVAGAGLSPPVAQAIAPGGELSAYERGGPKAHDLHIDGLKAVVAISPAGGGGVFPAWDDAGLRQLSTPALIIVGDQDQTVGYANVRSIFERAVNADRYLLVYASGGHSIGMDAAPPTMRAKLWDQDWFEDPVWSKARVEGVNLQFITAFLDLYVKGDQSRAPYLDLTTHSNDGAWPSPPPGTPYAAYSPGSGGVTVWKGFQRAHSAGLSFEHRRPATP